MKTRGRARSTQPCTRSSCPGWAITRAARSAVPPVDDLIPWAPPPSSYPLYYPGRRWLAVLGQSAPVAVAGLPVDLALLRARRVMTAGLQAVEVGRAANIEHTVAGLCRRARQSEQDEDESQGEAESLTHCAPPGIV